MKLTDIVDFNPRTQISKTGRVPFLDMAALPTSGRDVPAFTLRVASGSGSKFRNGDTLIARITPCLENGKGAQVAGLPGVGVGQGSTEFIVLRAKDPADADFVYYLSREPAFRSFAIQQMSGTSGRQRVNWQSLTEYQIEGIGRPQRKAVGAILASLDDKIEFNRRMNQTLEAMAQAIFRDWFIDFGPVRRKLAGETDPVAIMGGLTTDPARAAELAALFSAGFDGNHALPVGWAEEPVIDQANWVNGAAYKKMHFVPAGKGLPVIKIAELKAGVTPNTGFTNTDLGSRYRIDDGELLFSWSGNPDTSIDTFIWTGGPAWLNQHIFAVRSNGTRTLGFLFAMLKYLNPTFAEIARDKQTTGLGHVTKEDLRRLRQVVPDRPVEMAFDALMTPIFEKLRAAQLENRTLAETRDYLLPRLMSGAVRVGDTAATVA